MFSRRLSDAVGFLRRLQTKTSHRLSLPKTSKTSITPTNNNIIIIITTTTTTITIIIIIIIINNININTSLGLAYRRLAVSAVVHGQNIDFCSVKSTKSSEQL